MLVFIINKSSLDGPGYSYERFFDVVDCNGIVKQHKHYSKRSKLLSVSNGCFYEKSNEVKKVIKHDLKSLLPFGDINVKTNCPFFKWIPLNTQNRRRLVELGMLNHMNMSVDDMHQQIMSRILQNHIIFKPLVQEIIDKNEKTFKSYSLCIHIRTIGPNFLRFNDLSNVLRCINDHHISTSNLFICSDNASIQSTLGKKIPTKSKITYEKTNGKMSFNTLNREQQAVLFAEMKLLSMCQTYLGTYHSTWSYTNALFSNGTRWFIGHNAPCSQINSFSMIG